MYGNIFLFLLFGWELWFLLKQMEVFVDMGFFLLYDMYWCGGQVLLGSSYYVEFEI